MDATILYGIRNCDTMKKARGWLDAAGIQYRFHDYKVEGIDAATLERWCAQAGWERVLNRSGTTFRKVVPEAGRDGLDAPRAVALMHEHPSMIRRPVLQAGSRLLVGFEPATWKALLARAD